MTEMVVLSRLVPATSSLSVPPPTPKMGKWACLLIIAGRALCDCLGRRKNRKVSRPAEGNLNPSPAGGVRIRVRGLPQKSSGVLSMELARVTET